MLTSLKSATLHRLGYHFLQGFTKSLLSLSSVVMIKLPGM